MNLAIASSPAPWEIHSLRETFLAADYEKLKIGQRRRASVTPRPVSCFASSSSSSPPKEVAEEATTAIPIRSPERPTSCGSSSSDLANFKPPLPALPISPKDLARDLPFQYWYSYADLPPGIPKRKPKYPVPPTSESVKNRDDGGTGGNGSLWEAVLAVESDAKLDTPKVGRRKRGGGGVGGSREAEKGLLSTDYEKSFSRATSGALQEDENAPLSEDEKKKYIQSCHGTSRQINIGWEGWNPNYVALIHSYWKRSRVCKIKCKGALTLDIDSLCNMLEVETGGKVIKRVGGTVYLFRGQNYEYWKNPQQLIVRYDRVQKRFPKRLPVPCNLTEDIKALRARGRTLPALSKLGKHGVYLTLLEDIRKAFETQDLVRVNCQGFYSRNLKILGSQLQALVPCELISFEFEHILMWRSMDGNSPKEEVLLKQSEESCLVSTALS